MAYSGSISFRRVARRLRQFRLEQEFGFELEREQQRHGHGFATIARRDCAPGRGGLNHLAVERQCLFRHKQQLARKLRGHELAGE